MKAQKKQLPPEQTPFTHEQVFDIVADVLVEKLGGGKEEVTLEATLIDDLAAESIDAADIGFELDDRLMLSQDTVVLMLFAGHMRAMTVHDLCVGLERLLEKAGRCATI